VVLVVALSLDPLPESLFVLVAPSEVVPDDSDVPDELDEPDELEDPDRLSVL
jgi:hypothetical protein